MLFSILFSITSMSIINFCEFVLTKIFFSIFYFIIYSPRRVYFFYIVHLLSFQSEIMSTVLLLYYSLRPIGYTQTKANISEKFGHRSHTCTIQTDPNVFLSCSFSFVSQIVQSLMNNCRPQFLSQILWNLHMID